MLRLMLEVLARVERTDQRTAPAGLAVAFDDLQYHGLMDDNELLAAERALLSQSYRELCGACAWCPWREAPPDAPTDEALRAVVSRIDSNAFGCFAAEGDDPDGASPELCGHGIYLAASMFNHSCRCGAHATPTPLRSPPCAHNVAARVRPHAAHVSLPASLPDPPSPDGSRPNCVVETGAHRLIISTIADVRHEEEITIS